MQVNGVLTREEFAFYFGSKRRKLRAGQKLPLPGRERAWAWPRVCATCMAAKALKNSPVYV